MTKDEAFDEAVRQALEHAPDRAKMFEAEDRRLDLAIKQCPATHAYVLYVREQLAQRELAQGPYVVKKLKRLQIEIMSELQND